MNNNEIGTFSYQPLNASRVVLGATDPEMVAVAELAARFGVEVVQAEAPGRDGKLAPVGPWNAYKASTAPKPGDLWVECSPADTTHYRWLAYAIHIDHHNPGDRGYGVPPKLAFEASSLGQLLRALKGRASEAELEASRLNSSYVEELQTIGALDHCLQAACQGAVPGVPGERALKAFLQRPGMGTSEDYGSALEALEMAPTLTLGGVEVPDLRGLGCPSKRGRFDAGPLAGLRAVAMTKGIAYVSWVSTREGDSTGPRKLVIGGAGEGTLSGAEPVAAFMAAFEADPAFEVPYGDPARGFAGVYPVQKK